ncbi:hypothetical protein GGE66_000374 [Rhizobium leguminosarum]|uniref:LLM class flavin-dependent oxidoreductase n=1 Tax=Rhizobium leguminosarum TaxID=384 RepID=A0A7X0DQM0_RHILE|nr:hypothetical protein [Rhizobium leguminosarum]
MTRRKDQIKLGAFLLFTGHHVAAWRHPQASIGTEFENYLELAGLADFIELVVPELRRRGLFRHEYEGATLRDNLGLKRPANRFSQTAAVAAE